MSSTKVYVIKGSSYTRAVNRYEERVSKNKLDGSFEVPYCIACNMHIVEDDIVVSKACGYGGSESNLYDLFCAVEKRIVMRKELDRKLKEKHPDRVDPASWLVSDAPGRTIDLEERIRDAL